MTPQPGERAPPRQPIFNAPPGTLALCGTLVLCHVAFEIASPHWQYIVLDSFAFLPARFAALWTGDGAASAALVWLSLVSHAFLHADFLHLALNTGFLLAFGSAVERHVGTLAFCMLFAGCASAGALSETVTARAGLVYLIGASGAVYGMMGAAVPVMFRAGRSARVRRSLEFIAIILGLNLIFALVGLGDFLAGAQVAWRAHVGGFVAGLVLIFVFAPPRRRRA